MYVYCIYITLRGSQCQYVVFYLSWAAHTIAMPLQPSLFKLYFHNPILINVFLNFLYIFFTVTDPFLAGEGDG